MAWQAKYLAALQARDDTEQATRRTVENYTILADRLARHQEQPTVTTEDLPSQQSPRLGQRASTPDRHKLSAQVHTDLAEAQKARAALEAKAKELIAEVEALRAAARTDQKRIYDLSSEGTTLSKRVRDRDEELREKAKLLDDVHNETVALTIQLNVMEEQNAKLQAENKDLVDRWMARMGQEADAMNDASNFK